MRSSAISPSWHNLTGGIREKWASGAEGPRKGRLHLCCATIAVPWVFATSCLPLRARTHVHVMLERLCACPRVHTRGAPIRTLLCVVDRVIRNQRSSEVWHCFTATSKSCCVAHTQAAGEAMPQRSVQATNNVQRPWLSDSPVRVVSGSLREDVLTSVSSRRGKYDHRVPFGRRCAPTHRRLRSCPSRRLCTRCTVFRIFRDALPDTSSTCIVNSGSLPMLSEYRM